MKRTALFACLAFFAAVISAPAFAAVIHGTVYGIGLDEEAGAVVEINTEPRQQLVAKSAQYLFTVSEGNYTITARKMSGSTVASSASESIRVVKEGDYVLDLILFPDIEEDEGIIRDADFEIGAVAGESGSSPWQVALVVGAIIAFFVILRMKGKEIFGKHERAAAEGSELEDVIRFIKKEGGRTTQKEIRKNFPQSEAKISLVISELEHEGRIKKIKKGRGNIISLSG